MRKRPITTTVCGTFKRDVLALKQQWTELLSARFNILSPQSIDFVKNVNGFVYAAENIGKTPLQVELEHLDAIKRSDFVWLHAPHGYVGRSGSLEIGFAHAVGVSVFSEDEPDDPTLSEFVEVVSCPADVEEFIQWPLDSPPTALFDLMQSYYRKVAIERGYDGEDIRDCMLLLTEEVGELSRAVRKSLEITRHQGHGDESIGDEMADILLYVIHLANITGIDLSESVFNKEQKNAKRFMASANN